MPPPLCSSVSLSPPHFDFWNDIIFAKDYAWPKSAINYNYWNDQDAYTILPAGCTGRIMVTPFYQAQGIDFSPMATFEALVAPVPPVLTVDASEH